MKKRLIVLICVFTLFLAGCMGGGETYKSVEQVDQSTRIITYTETVEEQNYSAQEMEYIKDDQKYTVWFSANLRPALDYLKTHSKPSDKVLTWWDNGHLIRGYVRREPIVYTPSYDLLETVAGGKWDEDKLGPFSSKEDLTNVAYALLADSPTITQGIMKRYGARWVFVARIDQQKIAGMVQLLDEDLNNYLDDLNEPKQTVLHKVIFKMADGWQIKGFNMAYEDDYAYVYELSD
ncbi:hypothetical protein KY359_04785 [Candidatus Woesearchaeota archaeon]|nr:hypothetical protein [Candidatus Woesearchaeota archaeon]